MLMWYIIFVLLILFTGGGLLYLGTRAAKFVPAGSTPKRRLLIGLSAVILIFAVIAWLINLMNAVVCLLHFVFLWLVCDFIFTLVRRFRKRPFKRYYAGYAATALSLAALAAGWYLNHRVWVTAYTIESEKAISDLRIVLFADSHIGTTFDGEGFAKHVRAMQEQNPDLVVIAGDFVDDGTGREEMVAAARALGTLKTPRGVYFAFGNHDKGYYGPAYRGFSSGELIDELKKNNVKILEDESETVAGGFCLVGRQDRSEAERGGRRLTMQELTNSPSSSTISRTTIKTRRRRKSTWSFPAIPTAASFSRSTRSANGSAPTTKPTAWKNGTKQTSSSLPAFPTGQ